MNESGQTFSGGQYIIDNVSVSRMTNAPTSSPTAFVCGNNLVDVTYDVGTGGYTWFGMPNTTVPHEPQAYPNAAYLHQMNRASHMGPGVWVAMACVQPLQGHVLTGTAQLMSTMGTPPKCMLHMNIVTLADGKNFKVMGRMSSSPSNFINQGEWFGKSADSQQDWQFLPNCQLLVLRSRSRH